MITLSHLVSDIRQIASSGSEPIDFRITDEQIIYWINQVRATLITQELDKRQPIMDEWIQTINCVELEQVDKSECPCETIDCIILKSKLPIPSTIDTSDPNCILSVHGMDQTQIHKGNRFRAKYKKYNKYTSKNKSWYLKDSYLYIINDLLLEKVAISGIFEDPSELSVFNCKDEICFDKETSDYPISNKLSSVITDIVVKTKVLPFLQLPQDTSNNAYNESQPVPRKL